MFQARLRPSNTAAGGETRYLQMTGLGFPFVGTEGGHSYAGPGVDHRWDFQNNEYEVLFRFTGEQARFVSFEHGRTVAGARRWRRGWRECASFRR